MEPSKRTPQRTDLMDTSPWMHKVKLDLLRKMTPEQKLRSVFSQMEFMRNWRKSTEAMRHEPRD